MAMNEENDNIIYKVVVNHEEQYSIWPDARQNPLGWNDANKGGTKTECLEFIKTVWTDMRPLSLRKKMEQACEHLFGRKALCRHSTDRRQNDNHNCHLV